MVETEVSAPHIIRFGVYEADLRAGELRRKGRKLKLQEQPFQVLALLLEHPGQVVTREALREKLWPADTFVEFDHSLNTAISKIREALGDLADNPRFVETLPRRGYRFIAPVERQGGAPSPSGAIPQAVAVPEAPVRRWNLQLGLVLLVAVVLAGVLVVWLRAPLSPPKVVGSVQITNTGRVEAPDGFRAIFPSLVTDGARLYFSEPGGGGSESGGGGSTLAQVSIGGGDVLSLRTHFRTPSILDISPAGSELLVRGRFAGEVPLWIVPVLGGAPRRVGDVMAHDAAWLPNGQKIVYAHGQDLYLAKTDGSEPRKLVTVPGRAFWLRWSPDRRRLRFTLVDPKNNSRSLWEVSADGANLRPLLPGWNDPPAECCGNWTPDGKYFVFTSFREGRADIWALRENTSPFQTTSRKLTQLTAGPLHFTGPVPSQDGKRLFVVGGQPRSELLRYDLKSRQFAPYLSDISVDGFGIDFSQDREWVVYIRKDAVWRSKVDGSQQLQLTSPPMVVWLPRWSPDGKRIVFMGQLPGKPWKIYLVSTGGGSPQQLLPGERNEADPTWSPDGNSLIFGRPPGYIAEASISKAIHLLDLRTNQVSKLPGSDGLFSPRWSPDGRYVAAMPLNEQKLMLFDFTTQKWVELAERVVHNPAWSQDGMYIYFQAGPDILRVRVNGRELERMVSLQDLPLTNLVAYGFRGLAPDGSPLALYFLGNWDIYALDWQAP